MLTDGLCAQVATTCAPIEAQLRQGYQDWREAVRALQAADRRGLLLRPLLDRDLLLMVIAGLVVVGVFVWWWYRWP